MEREKESNFMIATLFEKFHDNCYFGNNSKKELKGGLKR